VSRLLFRDAVLLDPEAARPERGALLVEDGRIRAKLDPGARQPADCRVVDLGGRRLAPGFIDVHFHGSFIFAEPDDYEAALARDSARLARHGTTAFLVTTIAWPAPLLSTAVTQLAEILARARPPGAAAIGLHLEGPWISSAALGAQPREAVRDFETREGRAVLDRGEGQIRMVTLAPELAGAAALLQELGRRGIVAALGHSAADAETTREGVDRGLRHVTHLFNAMSGIHHRRPGAAGVALSDDRLTCDLICDGAHVDPALVRVAARAKAGRLLLISDHVDPNVSGGSASLDGASYLKDDGVALRLPDGRLAGSRLTLDRAIDNFCAFTDASIIDAVASCTLRPARLLGLEASLGTLRPGAQADLAVIDAAGQVCETWLSGDRIWVGEQPSQS
jgi:N-acetylglucosamine-6-phosphate deacetylase